MKNNMWQQLLGYKFANPIFLWAIPLFILSFLAWYYFIYTNRQASIRLSNTATLAQEKTLKTKLKLLLPFFRLLSIILILIALARPQTFDADQKINTYGIDIVLSVDVSASMLAKDFEPNRLEAAKDVASNFIKARPNDRIGLVTFSGESFTQVPITSDHYIVQEQLSKIDYGFLEQGTAIGMGVATGVNRLKASNSKSKVIILMTDGVNNAGIIDPKLAVETAIQYGIKIYTIGVGSKGKALMPINLNADGSFQYGYANGEIDEALLKDIAKNTNGKYFRATNKESLKTIYQEIDMLEKTEIESSLTIRKAEMFYPFAIIALLIFVLEISLNYTVLKSVL